LNNAGHRYQPRLLRSSSQVWQSSSHMHTFSVSAPSTHVFFPSHSNPGMNLATLTLAYRLHGMPAVTMPIPFHYLPQACKPLWCHLSTLLTHQLVVTTSHQLPQLAPSNSLPQRRRPTTCNASLSVVRLGRWNVDATVDDSAMVFGY
jgi:hypothetical protein